MERVIKLEEKLKEIKKDRFLKEKIILKLIFTTYYNKKLKELYKNLCVWELKAHKVKVIYEKKLREAHESKKKSLKNSLLIKLKRLTGFQKEKALIFNDIGEIIKVISIMPTENEFKFKGKEFIINRDRVKTRIVVQRLLEDEIFYFYNINNTSPITITNPIQAVSVSPNEFYAIMESKQLINLNKPSSGLGGLLEGNMKWVLLGVAGIIVYMLIGGG